LDVVTDVEIRPITLDDDFDAQLDLGQRAFGVYPAQDRASWLHAARLRAGQGLFLGAFMDGTPAGAAMLHDMRQYWLGRPVGCAGVAAVKVAPEHRGRGIGRRLMTELLDLIAERGYPVSALYPATMPIYRSLGWELAGAKYRFTIPARSLLAMREPDAEARGGGAGHQDVAIRRAGPADAATVTGVIGESHRAARDSGPVTWDVASAAEWLGRGDLYTYLAADAAGPAANAANAADARDAADAADAADARDAAGDGFAAYHWAGQNLWVERVQATSPQTLRALWSVIASHSSTAESVIGVTAPSDPFWWLTRERDATVIRRSMWMLRVVDLPAAIAARGFPAVLSVSVPLRVSDQVCPRNAGSWQLTVTNGTGTLIQNEGVSSPAPLHLGPRGVAALYAGTPLATLRLAGLASGGSPDADAALDAAFAATPYMMDSF
jgi:predicted acetyltransferase